MTADPVSTGKKPYKSKLLQLESIKLNLFTKEQSNDWMFTKQEGRQRVKSNSPTFPRISWGDDHDVLSRIGTLGRILFHCAVPPASYTSTAVVSPSVFHTRRGTSSPNAPMINDLLSIPLCPRTAVILFVFPAVEERLWITALTAG